ncbi:hypothetical protein GQR58_020455 [Nymphon striatum]|nr:hypothetical protein GQR58_020455 [Nymphon striatum]
MIKEDIAAGKTPCDLPLPKWVSEIDAVHNEQGSWSASENAYQAPSSLDVYKRHAGQKVGVGLIPAASGCMEFARRASIAAKGGDVFEGIKNAFETIGMGKVATMQQTTAHTRTTNYAAGRGAIANIKAAMTNMHAGQFISDYDMEIGVKVAEALCGGDVDTGTPLTEEWYLRTEREGFRS